MTHSLAPKTPYPDFVAQAWEDKALHHSLKEYVYEADIQNPDGEKTSGEVLEFDTDSEAIAWCENYLRNRAGSIELYRVPFVNESHMNTHDLWPDDVRHVARVESQMKNSDDECDALRLNDLAALHGLTYRKTASGRYYIDDRTGPKAFSDGFIFIAGNLKEAWAFAEGFDRARASLPRVRLS